jgi:hypothetical protein
MYDAVELIEEKIVNELNKRKMKEIIRRKIQEMKKIKGPKIPKKY